MMKKNLGNMLRQAQNLQQAMAKAQDELRARTVEASSGGGMVSCVVNGRQELLSLKIDPQVVDPGDVEMLQDLIVAAVGEAIRKSHEMMASEMNKLAGGMGLNLPGMF